MRLKEPFKLKVNITIRKIAVTMDATIMIENIVTLEITNF